MRADGLSLLESVHPSPHSDGALPHAFDFIIANPPASSGDDGFGFRRRILREAAVLLIGGL